MMIYADCGSVKKTLPCVPFGLDQSKAVWTWDMSEEQQSVALPLVFGDTQLLQFCAPDNS